MLVEGKNQKKSSLSVEVPLIGREPAYDSPTSKSTSGIAVPSTRKPACAARQWSTSHEPGRVTPLTLGLVGQELVPGRRSSLGSREVLVPDLRLSLRRARLQSFRDRADVGKAALGRDRRRREDESGEDT